MTVRGPPTTRAAKAANDPPTCKEQAGASDGGVRACDQSIIVGGDHCVVRSLQYFTAVLSRRRLSSRERRQRSGLDGSTSANYSRPSRDTVTRSVGGGGAPGLPSVPCSNLLTKLPRAWSRRAVLPVSCAAAATCSDSDEACLIARPVSAAPKVSSMTAAPWNTISGARSIARSPMQAWSRSIRPETVSPCQRML